MIGSLGAGRRSRSPVDPEISGVAARLRRFASGAGRRDFKGRGETLDDCHSERSEESALVRLGLELQIPRSAQDDTDFHLLGWAAGPW